MSYICDKCNKDFKTKYKLDRHLSSKQICNQKVILKENAGAYVCQFCSASYSTKPSLSAHIHKRCKESPHIKKESVSMSDIHTGNAVNGDMNTTTNTTTNINIFIDGVEFKGEELEMLDTSKKANIGKLIKKLPKLQRPFGREKIKGVDEDGFIELFENSPLIAFEKFIYLSHRDPQNKNITIINKHYPYITFIKDDLKYNSPQKTAEEKEAELDKITSKYLTNFFKYYDKYKLHLSDILINYYTEFQETIDGLLQTERSFIRSARARELEFNYDEKEDDNIYIVDEKLEKEDFPNKDEYEEYCEEWEKFQAKRDYYTDKYIRYCDRVKRYKKEPIKMVSGFLFNVSEVHTPAMKKHKKVVAEIDSASGISVEGK
mgnify:CR=1 FL=1